MKKYKLKKDLPLAKAGTIVTLRKSESASNIFNENNDRIYAIIDNTDINEWLEEITEKPKSVWDLKGGDSLYFIGSQDIICRGTWDVCNTFLREREIGLIFLTREEAEKELQKIKAIQKIKKYCWENNIDTKYNNVTDSYVFNLNDSGKVIFCNDYKNGNPLGYFSKKNVEEIFDNFQEELKIILN